MNICRTAEVEYFRSFSSRPESVWDRDSEAFASLFSDAIYEYRQEKPLKYSISASHSLQIKYLKILFVVPVVVCPSISCSLIPLVVRYIQMRISGGTAKGRRTATKSLLKKKPTGERLRPTSSKVREALFDILRNRIEGASFVDLYAGAGTVGFEALSRGAGRVIFVEQEESRVRSMKSGVDNFGFQDSASVFRGKAEEFLKKSVTSKRQFDIFFVDPPYDSEEIERILPLFGEGELLEPGGIVVVEHFFKKQVPGSAGRLIADRSYRYGDTTLTFYSEGAA